MSGQINLNQLPKDEEHAKEVLAEAVVEARKLLVETRHADEKALRNGDLNLLNFKIDNLFKEVEKINKKLDDSYVTEDKFNPVKNIVYGMVGLILVGVL